MTLQVISQTTSQIERYKSTIDLGSKVQPRNQVTLQVISEITSQIERYKSTIDLGKQGAAKEPGDIAGDIRDNKSD